MKRIPKFTLPLLVIMGIILGTSCKSHSNPCNCPDSGGSYKKQWKNNY